MGRAIEINEEIEKKVLHNYVDLNMSLCKSGEEFNLKQFHVEFILEKYGVNKRTYTEAKQLGRKFPCNDNYFKVQSHNMAYILGLLASDGCVSVKENLVAIQLLNEDKNILEKISEETGNTRPLESYIRKNTGHEIVSLRVWSREWKNDLAHYGIVPQKTFKLTPPNFLAPEYRIDYIRGYFDGDGTIYHVDTQNRTFVQIDGTCKLVIDWIKDELTNHYHVYSNKNSTETLSNGTVMYKIKIGSLEEIEKLYHLFYDDTDFYLLRKKEKFQLWLNIPRDSNSLDKE